MFHAFDNVAPDKAVGRADWMTLLSRAPLDLLESALAQHLATPPKWLRAPETGLMMVQGRAGATGERFNLGEVTVTRCALRLSGAELDVAVVGVAYVLGRSHRLVRLVAVADAMLQEPTQHAVLETTLLSPIRQHLALQRDQRNARAQSTRVEFFTVARETGDAGNDEESE